MNTNEFRTYELEGGIKYVEGDAWFQNVPLQDPDGQVTYSTGRSVEKLGYNVYVVEVFTDGDTGRNETLVEGRFFHHVDSDLREQLEDLKN